MTGVAGRDGWLETRMGGSMSDVRPQPGMLVCIHDPGSTMCLERLVMVEYIHDDLETGISVSVAMPHRGGSWGFGMKAWRTEAPPLDTKEFCAWPAPAGAVFVP